jgi:SAM-dependent methyltransferase
MTILPKQTDWTREAIRSFLEEEQPRGQRIALPHGLFSEGADCSAFLPHVFPTALAGKSVLEVGCGLGYFCLEAHRLGAGRVLGLDSDPERVAHAETIAAILGAPVEYRAQDLEDEPFPAEFDIVLFTNGLHKARDPTAMLDRLARATRERLVLDVTTPSDRLPGRLLRSLGAGWLTRWAMRRLPLIVVGRNGATGRPRERKFYFTPKALEHLLLHQRASFADCKSMAEPLPGRHVVVAEKRRIGRLLLVSGPSACGKSTIIERLCRGEAGAIATACDFDPAQEWASLDTTRIHRDRRARIDRLLLHYDILRPWRRPARYHRRVEGLDVLDCSDRVRVVTLLARPDVLLNRVEQRLETVSTNQEKRRRRLLDLRELYRRPRLVARLVLEWFEYLASRGIEPVIIDNGQDPPRPLAADRWEELILEK